MGGESCCSDGRSGGCCSCTAAASCRSRSRACPEPPARWSRTSNRAPLTYGHRFLATAAGRADRSRSGASRNITRGWPSISSCSITPSAAIASGAISRCTPAVSAAGSRCKDHGSLIEEVADLVEYPGVVAGFFDRAFLQLPEEVLSTTLVHHQHFFPVVDEKGNLKEAFLAVVNTQPSDERLIAKNAERVVAARLRDATFFWESDRRIPLEIAPRPPAHRAVPQEAGQLSRQGRTNRAACRLDRPRGPSAVLTSRSAPQRAAKLAKVDLTTDMVFEFPELQGAMGGIYAREEGQPEDVWKAIYHHYLPIGGRTGCAAVAHAARRQRSRGRPCRWRTSSTPSPA